MFSRRRASFSCGPALALVGLAAVMGAATSVADEAGPAPKNYAKQLSAAFRDAAKEVLPSVVSIQKTARPARKESGPRVPSRENPFEGTPFEDMFEDMFRNGGGRHRFEVPRRPQAGMGSGIVIDPSGIILTNNHVVAGGENGDIDIRVRLLDGREFQATKVKTDPRTDLAVLWIEGASDLKPARLGNSDQLEIGDWVLAVGHPFGLFESVTAGIISAKGRGIGVAEREDFLQTDAAINPGNSGGPLVNLDGEVVGINTAINSRTGGYQGAGFAIPINLVQWVTQQLIKDGSVRRAYLGTQIGSVTQELSQQFGVPVGSGALVTMVFDDSPANQAGLKPGDIVVAFADQKISKPRDLQAAVEKAEIGSRQSMVIVRDGKRIELQVEVKLQPKNFSVAQRGKPVEPEPSDRIAYEELGLEIGPVTQEDTERIGLGSAQGVVITRIAPDSPAALAGLGPGMIITQADRKTIRSVEDFDAVLKQQPAEKESLLFLVRTVRGSQFVVIRFAR